MLAWMYSHEDPMACESLRIMINDQPYSRNLAYKVLYNLNRESAYDLAGAFTPQQVGELFRHSSRISSVVSSWLLPRC